MCDDKTLLEKHSEKRKRGRPRGMPRNFVASELTGIPDGCDRTLINDVFRMVLSYEITKHDEATQRLIWGYTEAEIMAGKGRLPRGWKTMAEGVGRYMESTGADPGRVVSLIVDALKQGRSFRDITAHFRKLRLGKRQGNERALALALARVVDDYRWRFPETTDEQIEAAATILLESVRFDDVR